MPLATGWSHHAGERQKPLRGRASAGFALRRNTHWSDVEREVTAAMHHKGRTARVCRGALSVEVSGRSLSTLHPPSHRQAVCRGPLDVGLARHHRPFTILASLAPCARCAVTEPCRNEDDVLESVPTRFMFGIWAREPHAAPPPACSAWSRPGPRSLRSMWPQRELLLSNHRAGALAAAIGTTTTDHAHKGVALDVTAMSVAVLQGLLILSRQFLGPRVDTL
jgi:hypothetical protein